MFTFAPQNERIGALAQLVEHRTENPCVPGSIPGGTTPPFISPVDGEILNRVFCVLKVQRAEGLRPFYIFRTVFSLNL